MNHNPNECDIVQDLLPLYYDHACSPASCELVRQHLADCADCEKIYEDLANHTIDNVIETESCEILERHAKKERNLAYKAGIVIAALLLVPILITFIVSMAGGSGLGGHLKIDDLGHICFLSLPFMGLESHSVQFFNAAGMVLFSVYVGRENRQLIPAARESFFALREAVGTKDPS